MMGVCKFCGCTEETACMLPSPPFLLFEPCQWLLPDVCTNPACVEKAYREACVLADRMYGLEVCA